MAEVHIRAGVKLSPPRQQEVTPEMTEEIENVFHEDKRAREGLIHDGLKRCVQLRGDSTSADTRKTRESLLCESGVAGGPGVGEAVLAFAAL